MYKSLAFAIIRFTKPVDEMGDDVRVTIQVVAV